MQLLTLLVITSKKKFQSAKIPKKKKIKKIFFCCSKDVLHLVKYLLKLMRPQKRLRYQICSHYCYPTTVSSIKEGKTDN